LIPAVLFFYSCSSGSSTQTTTDSSKVQADAPIYDQSLPKGKVTDSILCKNKAGGYFSLYLPTGYTIERPFPCLYFFDAHARGVMPLNAYKELAEKYGFVLIGSDMSKNGLSWTSNNEVIKTMMEDTRSRINIDPKRTYTAGFSGGSRIASSVAIFNGGVAGVIGCAAGFPRMEQGLRNKFDYFGMAGDYDFNLIEMVQLDEALGQNGFAHQFLSFSGKHGWASAGDFETGMLWIQVNAMKENLQPRNDTLINALKNDYDLRIKASLKKEEWITAHELLQGMVSLLDGLTDITGNKKQLADLVAGEGYKIAISVRGQLQEQEINLQQDLARDFTTQDEGWWTKKIAELGAKAHNSKTPQESKMYQRLLNYLGLVGYMSCSHAIGTSDLANAATYLKIFKMADPENPDCSYLSADYFMKKGDTKQALIALGEATGKGYSEVATIVSDPVFISLHNDPVFIDILGKVKANSSLGK
jgi:hypothetical protein